MTVGVRWTSDDGSDDLYVVADAINGGGWGYNNLQWYGATYYHKFNDHWHIAFETYNLHQNNVPNVTNPAAVAIVADGGSPFGPDIMPFNAPNFAECKDPNALTCTASVQTFLTYVNYSPNKLNNFSFVPEWYDDMEGQRTGTKSRYPRPCRSAGSTGSRRRSSFVRNCLLQVARCACLQRQFQRGNRSQQELCSHRRRRPDHPLLI